MTIRAYLPLRTVSVMNPEGKGMKPPMAIKIYMPIRTVNPLNTREHWGRRKDRAAKQRFEARETVKSRLAAAEISAKPNVKLVRIGPRHMDDDGSIASLKHVRDGIADALKMDDGAFGPIWTYAQRKDKEYGVDVEISW